MTAVARKTMKLQGRKYWAGAQVPLQDFDPELRRILIEQKRVVFREPEPEEPKPTLTLKRKN